MLFGNGIEDPDAFVHDIDADAVTGNEVDFVRLHSMSFRKFYAGKVFQRSRRHGIETAAPAR